MEGQYPDSTARRRRLLLVQVARTLMPLLRRVGDLCGLLVVAAASVDAGGPVLRTGRLAAVLVGEETGAAGEPDAAGALGICRELRAIRGDVPILALCSRGDEEDLISSLELGADDCLRLPLPPSEIVARLGATLRRIPPVQAPAERPIVVDGVAIDPRARRARREGHLLRLTDTEFDLLAALAGRPGRTFSRERLLNELCEYDYEIDSRTIDVHVRNLRCKVETEPSQPALIRSIPGVGYCFGRSRR